MRIKDDDKSFKPPIYALHPLASSVKNPSMILPFETASYSSAIVKSATFSVFFSNTTGCYFYKNEFSAINFLHRNVINNLKKY